MLPEASVLTAAINPTDGFWLIVKAGIIVLLVLYFVFSLIVVRQVSLMTETLITEVSPVLRFFSVVHAGLALGIVVLFIGFLFG